VAERNTELGFGARGERIAAGGLAGFRAAQLQYMPACGLLAEIMVEREHAMNLGAREVERGCDHRDCRFGHVAKGFLQSVQDDQRRALKLCMLGNDLGAARFVPGFVDRRHPCLSNRRVFTSCYESWNRSRYQ